MVLNPSVNSHRVEMCLLAILVLTILFSTYQPGLALSDLTTILFSSRLHILFLYLADSIL